MKFDKAEKVTRVKKKYFWKATTCNQKKIWEAEVSKVIRKRLRGREASVRLP